MINKELLKKYSAGSCSAEEKILVESWYVQFRDTDATDEEISQHDLSRLDNRIGQIASPKPLIIPLWMRSVAAILMVGLFSGLLYLLTENMMHIPIAKIQDIDAPHGYNATIYLDSNTAVNVDSLSVGDTVYSSNYLITKGKEGQLVYLPQDDASELITNEIRTKAGGSVQFVLSDGTKVWLNANSSLTFPVQFNAHYREVLLTGEGYFEVVSANKLPNQPTFLVKSANHITKVFGTAFNINAYGQKFVATLLEGKIALDKQKSKLGEEAVLINPVALNPWQEYNESSKVKVSQISVPEQALDWKNGYFNFSDQSFAEIATKLTNWYGVQFDLHADVQHKEFYGQITRNKKLSQVLRLISEVTDLKLELTGNVVTVKNK